MGGNLIKNSVPVLVGDIQKFIPDLMAKLGFYPKDWVIVGSAASFDKNMVVNDIDIAVDISAIFGATESPLLSSRPDAVLMLVDILACAGHTYVRTPGLSMVSIGVEFKGKIHQVDFFVTDNIDFISNLFCADAGPYKSVYRNILMGSYLEVRTKEMLKPGLWRKSVVTATLGFGYVIQTNLNWKGEEIKKITTLYSGTISKNWADIAWELGIFNACHDSFLGLLDKVNHDEYYRRETLQKTYDVLIKNKLKIPEELLCLIQ